MATLVLSAVGTLIGGPIGGALGTLLGGQIDAAIFGPKGGEGPRLKELAVTTSSYGTPVPRHFGKMRAAGSIIWATDLKESSENVGGGKGQPSVTTYSYSTSFAVALSSRAIQSVGRIWADGNLLRGKAGDLKTPGKLRIYRGHGDQQADPLIASAEGRGCPAFRGFAYCVFENLALADFGNRIPALTFEIFADNGDVQLCDLLEPLDFPVAVNRSLAQLEGYSQEGESIAATLIQIDQVFPIACEVQAGHLSVFAADEKPASLITLPEPAIDLTEEAFGGTAGYSSQRREDSRRIPAGLRYYDIEREFQAGLQRVSGRALPGQNRILEFPGALQADTARALANAAADRSSWSQERLSWRIAEIDPAIRPGQIVALPDRSGSWRIESWEWRERGVELELQRLPYRSGDPVTGATGRSLTPADVVATPTILTAFELPWDGTGSANEAQTYAAPSSQSSGWTGAMLYANASGALEPLQASGSRRSIIGSLTTGLPAGQVHLISRLHTLELQLDCPDLPLSPATLDDLAQGANRMLVGEEMLQFANAQPLGNGRWRLTGLLRGRAGTERFAFAAHPAGTRIALLDDKPILLDQTKLASATSIAAIGLADDEPAVGAIAGRSSTKKPLAPVHTKASWHSDGTLELCWTRRARGAWRWDNTVEVPLIEQDERYVVGIGDVEQPLISWETLQPRLSLNPASAAQIFATYPGLDMWVRQSGTHASSDPVFITQLS